MTKHTPKDPAKKSSMNLRKNEAYVRLRCPGQVRPDKAELVNSSHLVFCYKLLSHRQKLDFQLHSDKGPLGPRTKVQSELAVLWEELVKPTTLLDGAVGPWSLVLGRVTARGHYTIPCTSVCLQKTQNEKIVKKPLSWC